MTALLNADTPVYSTRATADAFDAVWQQGTYAGFSRNTPGESSTPFLDCFVGTMKALHKPVPRVVELGAGSCDHALRCAREGFNVVAVEYSRAAVELGAQMLRAQPELQMNIIQDDLMAFTSRLPRASVDGLYANSVFHCLTSAQRMEQYAVLRDVMVPRGVVAISFKSQNDSLHRRGTALEDTPAGTVVRGEDGIPRLFVSHVEGLVAELHESGYAVTDVLRWSVPNYNIVNECGEFVGLLARRAVPMSE